MKFAFYMKNYLYNQLPQAYFKHKYKRLQNQLTYSDRDQIQNRVNYYCQLTKPISLHENSEQIKEFSFQKPSAYYFDLKRYFHYFQPSMRISYRFSDETTELSQPGIVKARKIQADEKAVLFKLDRFRHFQFVEDSLPFHKKKNIAVWRGVAHQPERQKLLQKFFDNKLIDVGDTSSNKQWRNWQKGRLTKQEQLKHKIILCPQGYDVATSLKWVFSSNSLCVMPKPTRESWFMEGRLVAGKHYVEVKNDWSNLPEIVDYYFSNNREANEIIQQANEHVSQFQNKKIEEASCIELIKRYAEMTNQPYVFRYNAL